MKNTSILIFLLVIAVEFQWTQGQSFWSEFGDWSNCSANCGEGGSRNRNRTCVLEEVHGPCEGSSIEFEFCIGPSCPNNAPHCLIDNGNCSHFCFFDGDGMASFCACPCGQSLLADNRTCALTVNCSVDLYVAIDANSHIDPTGCDSGVGPFPNWLDWRDSVLGFLLNFADLEASPNYRVGVQLYGSIVETIDNYTSDSLANLNISQFIMPLCDSEIGSVLSALSGAAEEPSDPAYSGPADSFQTQLNTTRIALLFVYQQTDEFDDETLLTFHNNIMEFLDQIIVVTRSLSDPTENQRNEERSRLIACGNATAPCRNLFWIDKNNDFDVPFDYLSLLQTMETDDCNIALVETDPLMELSCDEEGMTYSLALCPLAGLTPDMLQFQNSSCSLTEFPSGPEDTIDITVAYGDCGMAQEFVVENGVVQSRFIQTITTRNLDPYQTLPDVLYTISCTLTTLGDYYTAGGLRPAPDKRNGSATETGDFELTYNIYNDSSYSFPAPDSQFVVGCQVYVEVDATLLEGLKLVLWSCWATPSPNSSDTVNYILANEGCAVDDTFSDNTLSNTVHQISFAMFEFSSGYKKPVIEKPLVYVHCNYWICELDDFSPACTPICFGGGLGKRSIPDNSGKSDNEKKLVTTTIGPLQVENSKAENADENQKTAQGIGKFEAKIDMPPTLKKQTATRTKEKAQNEEQRKLSEKTQEDPAAQMEESYYPSDFYSSIRRIQIVVPAAASGWANSLLSVPSLTFLLLVLCLLGIIIFAFKGLKDNSHRLHETISNVPYPIVSPDMQLSIKQQLPMSQNVTTIPPPEYKP